MELGRFFGFLHPALVHFPLVLLLVSVALEAIGFARRDNRFTFAAQLTLLIGTVAMLFAFVCGNFAEIWAARDGVPQDPMENHELFATITSWLFVFLTAARLLMGRNPKRRQTAVYLVLALAGCVLLGVTGHRGAMLVYHHAAGVQIGTVPMQITHEDIAVLRQKQDPDALLYSNMMHHIFGVMVLLLSGMLLLDNISPAAGEKLRKFGPILLLAGGLFLLIYSDADSWPLSHQRPITDKEVLMHKTYAILMLIVGIRGLWKRRGGSAPSRQMQSRMMAVFALVGGALLFTHVHSNAPYTNTAVGVYLHHTVMGFIALMIGAVKLMEDALSGRGSLTLDAKDRQEGSAVRLARGLKWAYPALMLIESIFLINYNEGLPWFLGYRNLSIVGPHNGLVAPLGRDRAELIYDQTSCRFDMYVLKQSSSAPSPIVDSAADPDLVIRIGTQPTELPLVAIGPNDPGHYWGVASFLKDVPMFQVQALVPAGHSSSTDLVADFEPWTDPKSVVGHTSQAAYICPMHPALGSGTPGHCPVCGMSLVPNKGFRPWYRLHDDSYHMDMDVLIARSKPKATQFASAELVHASPAMETRFIPVKSIEPGQTVRLQFAPRRADGSIVSALEIVHTKKLHLIIASTDLSFFDHVHPVQQPDGTLLLDYAFPHPGDYELYADITPTGDRNQVFRLPVHVEGVPPPAQELEVTPAGAKVFGPYRVQLDMTPNPPLSSDETQLAFTISKDGVPVSDIQPFLGAGGHCVVLSQDTKGYLHSHPLVMGGTQFGPTINFHTLFPRPGIYKIWGQFLHQGKVLTADFVVRVQKY